MSLIIKYLSSLCLIFLLTACGGGGSTPSPTPTSFTITATAGTNGSITPASSIVQSGLSSSFTVTPATGYTALVGGSCGGSLIGTTYTTNAITGDCTVAATFSKNSYTVTASAGTNGSITPPSATVQSGATTAFTVTPAAGYQIATVTGCNGSLSGSIYTTGTITADCAVAASFSKIALPTTLTLKLSTSGSLPTGSGISGLQATITLPAGVTVATNADGSVQSGVVMPSGTFPAGSTSLQSPLYNPATAILQIVMASTLTAGVTQAGECATIILKLDPNAAAIPDKTAFGISNVSIADLQYRALSGMSVVASGLSW